MLVGSQNFGADFIPNWSTTQRFGYIICTYSVPILEYMDYMRLYGLNGIIWDFPVPILDTLQEMTSS